MYYCGYDEYGFCDDELPNDYYVRKHISFAMICDDFTELLPLIIDGKNQTDETECQYWSCNNTYTRCDGFWNCLNGADEVDCDPSPALQCLLHHHICISPITHQLMCLPISKANDGFLDCLGGTDEPALCRSNDFRLTEKNYYCTTYTNERCITTSKFCYENQCIDESDKKFCDQFPKYDTQYSICWDYSNDKNNVLKLICHTPHDFKKPIDVHFTLNKSMNSIETTKQINRNVISSRLNIQQKCHRGLPLRVWTNYYKNLFDAACLCPPVFYGNQCQYQNQRVALTLRFRTSSDSRSTLFALVILIIDNTDQRIIHSYQQLTYLYTEHCHMKFNFYLLYSNRPKIFTRNYSIHIDVYEKISFNYCRSFLFRLEHAFLPVHRVAVQLDTPHSSDSPASCSNLKCVLGRCLRYFGHRNDTSFCQCDRGWTGKHCQIPYSCSCSSHSLCLGLAANNRSICICPINKWGSHCFYKHNIVQLTEIQRV